MWLLAGQKAPDHSTIARFRQIHATNAMEDLFYQLVNLLYEMGEIEYENVFIDGTKIEANANRYTFVWNKVVMKNEAKMHEKITLFLNKINMQYIQAFTFTPNTAADDLVAIVNYLKQKCNENGIVFVHGSGKRPTLLQKHYDTAKEYLDRQKNMSKKQSLRA